MTSKEKVAKNVFWKFSERITAQLVTFIISILLARILDPAHYGVIALVNIFIDIANVFVSDGLGTSLIQKKDADELDYSTVLYTNIIFSVVLYVILYFCAPLIGNFYANYRELSSIIRVLGIKLIFASVNSVQQAYVAKNMIFKKFFWATLVGTLFSGVIGLYMAQNGYGAWAIVGQYLTNSIVDTILLGIVLKKIPKLEISYNRLKPLFKFGINVLLSNMLTTIYTKIRAFIIGKIYTSDDLAYYQKGAQFPDLLTNNINVSIGAVLFPALAEIQDDTRRIREITSRFIRLCGYVIIPMLIGLAAISNTLVKVLLTEKWLPCVPYLQLLCIHHVVAPIHTANIQAIKALGRSDILLKLEIIKKTVEILSLIIVMRISVFAIVINMVIMTYAFLIVNTLPNRKLINYGLYAQIKDITPSVLMSILMGGAVLLVSRIQVNLYVSLFLQILVGVTIYIMLSKMTKNQQLKEIKDLLHSFVVKIRTK